MRVQVDHQPRTIARAGRPGVARSAPRAKSSTAARRAARPPTSRSPRAARHVCGGPHGKSAATPRRDEGAAHRHTYPPGGASHEDRHDRPALVSAAAQGLRRHRAGRPPADRGPRGARPRRDPVRQRRLRDAGAAVVRLRPRPQREDRDPRPHRDHPRPRGLLAGARVRRDPRPRRPRLARHGRARPPPGGHAGGRHAARAGRPAHPGDPLQHAPRPALHRHLRVPARRPAGAALRGHHPQRDRHRATPLLGREGRLPAVHRPHDRRQGRPHRHRGGAPASRRG